MCWSKILVIIYLYHVYSFVILTISQSYENDRGIPIKNKK